MIPYNPSSILTTIFGIPIYSYEFFGAIAAFVLIFYAIQMSDKFKINSKDVFFCGIGIVLFGLFGAKIFFMIQFQESFFRSGLVFYGGLIFSLIFLVFFARYRKIKILTLLDLFALSIPLAHAISRMGCFFRGCCHGAVMKEVMPWSVYYLDAVRHPAQLYSVIGNLIIFFILFFAFRYFYINKQNKRRYYNPGFFISLYLILYSIFRFIIEFFRDNPLFIYNFTFAQFVSIILFLIGIAIFYFISSKKVLIRKNK
jgi:phosphatidylglycerol---prolipoprotein diacylglyceryl transferase